MSNPRRDTYEAILIPADITAPIELLTLPKNGGLVRMYEAIGEGCREVEPYELDHPDPKLQVTVWCPGEGHLHRLTNARATMLMRGRVFMEEHGIKGNVVVSGPPKGSNGNPSDVPAEWVDRAEGLLAPGVGLPGGMQVVFE